MRLLRLLVITGLAVGSLTQPAFAGGSTMDPYRESYRPGETVVMRGDVSPGQLGWVEDGPFHAYLRVDPTAGAGANTFPYIDESDIYLGDLVLRELSSGWVAVSISFTLPADIPDGEYWIVYCNDPCTEGLGDLIGGWFEVRSPPPAAPPRSAHLICFSSLRPV